MGIGEKIKKTLGGMDPDPITTTLKIVLYDGLVDNPDIRDEYGETPLMRAAWLGYTPIVRDLIEMGADVHARDVYGRTPMMYAQEQRNQGAIALLLEAGATQERLPVITQKQIDATEAIAVEIRSRKQSLEQEPASKPVRFSRDEMGTMDALEALGLTEGATIIDHGPVTPPRDTKPEAASKVWWEDDLTGKEKKTEKKTEKKAAASSENWWEDY